MLVTCSKVRDTCYLTACLWIKRLVPLHGKDKGKFWWNRKPQFGNSFLLYSLDDKSQENVYIRNVFASSVKQIILVIYCLMQKRWNLAEYDFGTPKLKSLSSSGFSWLENYRTTFAGISQIRTYFRKHPANFIFTFLTYCFSHRIITPGKKKKFTVFVDTYHNGNNTNWLHKYTHNKKVNPKV